MRVLVLQARRQPIELRRQVRLLRVRRRAAAAWTARPQRCCRECADVSAPGQVYCSSARREALIERGQFFEAGTHTSGTGRAAWTS